MKSVIVKTRVRFSRDVSFWRSSEFVTLWDACTSQIPQGLQKTNLLS